MKQAWGRTTMLILLAGLAGGGIAGAQARGAMAMPGSFPAHSAQGQLTVTVTVVASVGLVTGPDGVQRLVVANGSDVADNVSFLKPFSANSGSKPSAKPTDEDETSRKKPNQVAQDVRTRRL
jgi:hypothetical protein